MGLPRILPGYIIADVTSADIAGFLNGLSADEIILQNIRYRDPLTVRITVRRQDYRQFTALAEKHGAVINENGTFGVFPIVSRFVKRPVLVLFLLIAFLFICYVPGRIFFISVEGNVQVPDKYILEAAAECGIDFGAKRRSVRSEMMKNSLLETIPQLQWAGINTQGCTAVISVREKTAGEAQVEPNHQVSSIVAARDGIIQDCTVYQGNALCAVGQAVKAGQILVSGYLDCGIITKTTRADAEIKALTYRDLQVVALTPSGTRGEKRGAKSNFSLKIGKKLIKFYKDSGNLDTSCGKIYTEEYVYLPGRFRLPIAIIKETVIYSDINREELLTSETGEWLKEFADDYLKNTMISGEIIAADTEVTADNAAFCLRGRYACSEMIGLIKNEETIPKDDE